MQDAATALLARAAELGVTIWAENGELRYRSRKGAMPDDLAAELRSCKQALLGYLSLPPTRVDSAVPTFAGMPKLARVPSFRQATWDGIKSGRTGVDSSNCRFVTHIRSELDVDAIEAACHQLLSRHDVLQVVFEEVQGSPWLLYDKPRPWRFDRYDLSGVASERRQARARDLAGALVWQTIDLSAGPLFKAFLIKLGAADFVFGIVIHHLIGDATTLRLLLNDVSRCYSQQGSRPERADTFQYRDYLLVMDAWLREPAVQAQLSTWAKYLASAPPMDLRRATARWVASPVAVREPIELDADLTEAIERTARQLRTTAFMLLLTAQMIAIAHLTEEREIIMGGVTDGREQSILEPVVGYLADRVYWRVSLDGNPTLIEALARVRAALIHTMRHEFLRSDFVIREVTRQGSRIVAPMFNFLPRSHVGSPSGNANNWSSEKFDLPPSPSSTLPTPGISYWFMLEHLERGMRGHIIWPEGVAHEFLPCFRGVLLTLVQDTGSTLDQSACYRRET